MNGNIPSEVVELAEKSGNRFHAKIARLLAAEGWHVSVSPYYLDQIQSKARELDIVAERVWPVTDMFERGKSHILVRLFVECKYVARPSVFWFAEKDHVSCLNHVCHPGLFRPDNTYTEKHHYLAGHQSVAKLFSSTKTRETENEPIFRAVNQCLNGLISLREKKSAHPDLLGKLPRTAQILDFPVVVLNSFSETYQVDFRQESAPSRIFENFLFEVEYAYMNARQAREHEYFLVDFVAEESLGDYLAQIAIDGKTGAFFASET